MILTQFFYSNGVLNKPADKERKKESYFRQKYQVGLIIESVTNTLKAKSISVVSNTIVTVYMIVCRKKSSI